MIQDAESRYSDRRFHYTVGATKRGWYIRMPWHLRGSAAELIEQMGTVAQPPDGCLGIEYWDGHVQFLRYRFPWCGDE